MVYHEKREEEEVGVCGSSVRQDSESFAPSAPSNFLYGKMYPM